MSTVKLPRIAIAMRSYNDIDVIRQTLEMVTRQSYPDFELWNFDSSSTDGTLEVIREFNDESRIRLNDSASYNPGKVLNSAMNETDAEIVVFLNSDATPESEDWLEKMLAPFVDDEVAAVYGRQTSRPDCRTLFHKDNERAFGDGSVSSNWIHFFSMANSAIRRSVYESFPFETRIQYSEDIEWSYRVKKAGYKIAYVADAVAMHSHNYTLTQSHKRHFGEGKAEAWIFRGGELNTSTLRYFLLPFGMEVLRDLYWGIRHFSIEAILHTVPLRFAQKLGRWQGLRKGIQDYGIN